MPLVGGGDSFNTGVQITASPKITLVLSPTQLM
jgi:hypothetical protein